MFSQLLIKHTSYHGLYNIKLLFSLAVIFTVSITMMYTIGMGRIRIILPNPDRDRHALDNDSDPADPNRYQVQANDGPFDNDEKDKTLIFFIQALIPSGPLKPPTPPHPPGVGDQFQ
jgi:hypothetical protein